MRQLPITRSSRPTSSSRVLGGTAGKGAAVEMGVVVGSCRSPNRFSIWILSGAAAELVQCTIIILYQITNLKSYCRSVLVF